VTGREPHIELDIKTVPSGQQREFSMGGHITRCADEVAPRMHREDALDHLVFADGQRGPAPLAVEPFVRTGIAGRDIGDGRALGDDTFCVAERGGTRRNGGSCAYFHGRTSRQMQSQPGANEERSRF